MLFLSFSLLKGGVIPKAIVTTNLLIFDLLYFFNWDPTTEPKPSKNTCREDCFVMLFIKPITSSGFVKNLISDVNCPDSMKETLLPVDDISKYLAISRSSCFS